MMPGTYGLKSGILVQDCSTLGSLEELNPYPATAYGRAHLFRSDTCRKLGALAERSLTEHAPDPATLAWAVGIHEDLAETVYERVIEKLRSELVEKLSHRLRRRLRYSLE